MQPPHPQTALADRFRRLVDAVQDDAIFMLDPEGTVLSPVHHTARRFGATVAGVKSLARIGLAAGVFAWCLSAHSETLRCNGHTLETGDARVSVRYYCGEPLLQDAYCAPVYSGPGLQRVPEPFASAVVPCLVVEEWLYDRGPGSLAATVRFRSGVVQSITYGARATPP